MIALLVQDTGYTDATRVKEWYLSVLAWLKLRIQIHMLVSLFMSQKEIEMGS